MRAKLSFNFLLTLFLTSRLSFAVNPMQPQSSTFDSAGVKISYVEAGVGEPVILVHGPSFPLLSFPPTMMS